VIPIVIDVDNSQHKKLSIKNVRMHVTATYSTVASYINCHRRDIVHTIASQIIQWMRSMAELIEKENKKNGTWGKRTI
jgi:predicted RNA-binding protein with RPS1 domain